MKSKNITNLVYITSGDQGHRFGKFRRNVMAAMVIGTFHRQREFEMTGSY